MTLGKTIRGGSILLVLLLVLLGIGTAIAEDEISLPAPDVTIEELAETAPAVNEQDNGIAGDPIIEPEQPIMYLLTWKDHEGKILREGELEEGTPIAKPVLDMDRDGFAFIFWYDAKLLEQEPVVIEEFVFGNGIWEDTVLLPLYEEIIAEDGRKETDVEQPGPNDEEPETMPGILLGGDTIQIIDDPETLENMETSPLANCVIRIYSTHESCMNEGDTVKVWAELIGFEGLIADFQWQYSVNGEWVDVPGANDLSHTFAATSESINYGWRLAATILD